LVGENSSNPFEGGSNDVPISFIARRIEIEMRTMLGEQTDLKPIEAKHNIPVLELKQLSADAHCGEALAERGKRRKV
jgi:hypothetical protein